MKAGDIIRSTCGVGRYIRVTDVIGDQLCGIYMSKIGNVTEESLLPISEYVEANVYRLSISKEEFDRISVYNTTIHHEATKSWIDFIDQVEKEKVDLVMFFNKTKKVYYTISGARRTIRMMWNKQRTICKRTPCVSIALGNLIAIE